MPRRTCLTSLALILLLVPGLQAQSPPEPRTPPEERVVPADTSVMSAIAQGAADFLSGDPTGRFEFDRKPKPIVEDNRAWVSADYSVSFLRGTRTTPLVTGSPAGTSRGTAGVIGQPTTGILLGLGEMDAGAHSGLRFGGGMWLSRNDRIGVEASLFFLESRSALFGVSSSGQGNAPAIGRPFVDAVTARETAGLTAFPGQLAGSINAASRTSLWGTETNVLYREEPGRFFRTTFLGGLRYVDMEQQFTIDERSTPLGTATIPFGGNLAITNPDGVRIHDEFRTYNHFFGPQVGFRSTWDWRRLSVGVGAKLALGLNHQTVEISGRSEAVTANGQLISALRGGLLANGGNIGRYTRNPFAAVPEGELKFDYRITDSLTAYVSGNFLYWTDVLNAGDQITRNVNLARVPTSGLFNPNVNLPGTTTLTPSNFWANSIQVGVCLKF